MNSLTIPGHMARLSIELFEYGEVLSETRFAVPLEPVLWINDTQCIKYRNDGEAGI